MIKSCLHFPRPAKKTADALKTKRNSIYIHLGTRAEIQRISGNIIQIIVFLVSLSGVIETYADALNECHLGKRTTNRKLHDFSKGYKQRRYIRSDLNL